MADSSPDVVVCDAGPLIHLDELSCLDLLNDFSSIIIPASVWKEAEYHRPGIFTRNSCSFIKIDSVIQIDAGLQAIATLLMLHQGETDALGCVRQKAGAVLLTDDSAARLGAKMLNIRSPDLS